MGKIDNDESTKIDDENSKNEIIDVLKEFLKDTNLKEVLDSYNNGRKTQTEANTSAHKINLKFFGWKFIKESFVILIILVSIGVFSYLDKIDNCTLGTLLGSIIGYTIGNFNSTKNTDS